MDTNMSKQITRLTKKLSRFYSDWIVSETIRELFWDKPQKDLSEYVSTGEKWEFVGSRTGKLLTWNYSQYANAVLNEDRYPLDEFALCARYAKAAVQFEAAFADAGQNGSILLHQAAFNFSLNILSGWRTDANTVGRLLVSGLDTSLLDLKHNDRHKKGKFFRHFWFLLHLYCSAKGLILDTSLYSYPEDMSPYDVENRQSDNGFYVEPSNQLNVYPITSGGATFTNNTYHDVALVNSAGVVYAYMDGTLSFSAATNVMDINNTGNLMNFFLDNTSGGGIGEYSSGRVALISLYSGALTASDVANIAGNPFAPSVPEPEEYIMMLLGFGMVGYQIKRKQRKAAPAAAKPA